MPKRKKHYLKPNSNLEVPHNAIWFDTETDQVVDDLGRMRHSLDFAVGAYTYDYRNNTWADKEYKITRNKRDFWKWVDSKVRAKTKLYLFCHNTNFDLPVLDIFNELAALGWQLKTAIIDAPPTILKFRKATATIEVLDTLNIWRMPLKSLGNIVGLEKLDMPDKSASQEAWETYARRDVDIIAKACLDWWQFLKSNDLGGFAPTLASQSLRTYRHKYMKEKILIDDNVQALQISRRGYLGGRTEAFRLGKIKGPIHIVDVNSMYPYVMSVNKYPVRLVGTTKRATIDDLILWLKSYSVVSTVELQTNIAAYPYHDKGKLLFPVGNFIATLNTPELLYALERGHIVRVIDAVVYENADLFSSFVRDFYNKRLEAAKVGDKASADNWKKLINSHYGKYGQRGIIYESAGMTHDLSANTWTELDAETGKIIKWRQLGGLVQRQRDEDESFNSFPAIAGHVTAYARMYLFKLIFEAHPGDVYYVDTDSLFLTTGGYERLTGYLDEHELGKMKLVKTAPHMTIYGLKDYTMPGEEKHKGIRKKAIKVEEGLYVQEKWSSLKGLLRYGSLDYPTTEYIIKGLKRKYDKGTVLPDGRIIPFRLDR